MGVSAPLLDSPDLVFDKPPASRHRAVFKSLPVLGKEKISLLCKIVDGYNLTRP